MFLPIVLHFKKKIIHWMNLFWCEIMQWLGLCCWLWQWRICLQCRRPGFELWVGKISWRRRREWLPTPVSLPEEFHGQTSLVRSSPWGSQRVWHEWVTNTKYWQCNDCTASVLRIKEVITEVHTWLQNYAAKYSFQRYLSVKTRYYIMCMII